MRKSINFRGKLRGHSFRLPLHISEQLGQQADDEDTTDTQIVIKALKNYFAHQQQDPLVSKMMTRLGRIEGLLRRISDQEGELEGELEQ